jgi:hypothetical protein
LIRGNVCILCKTERPYARRGEPQQFPIVARWIDIDLVASPPVIERKLEPMVTPRGLVMVIISIALTIVIVERLFGGMIYERPASGRKYTSAN